MRGLIALLLASCWLTCPGPAPLAAQDMPLSQALIDGQGWELVADGFQFTADFRGAKFDDNFTYSCVHKLQAVIRQPGNPWPGLVERRFLRNWVVAAAVEIHHDPTTGFIGCSSTSTHRRASSRRCQPSAGCRK